MSLRIDGSVYYEGKPANVSSIFAADEKGNLFLGMSPLCRHHSFILTSSPQDMEFGFGKDVSSAGNVSLCDGKIIRIDNHSGHYLPCTEQFLIYVKYLKDLDLLDPAVKIQYFDKSLNALSVISYAEVDTIVNQINLSQYPLKPLPSFKELLNMASDLVNDNPLQVSPQYIAAPVMLEENPTYNFIGKSIAQLLPSFPAKVSELPCPIGILGEMEFSLFDIQWKAKIAGGYFVSHDLITKLLSTTLGPDHKFTYEYLINSSIDGLGGVLSLTAVSENALSIPAIAPFTNMPLSTSPKAQTNTYLHVDDEYIESPETLCRVAHGIVTKRIEALNKEITIVTLGIDEVQKGTLGYCSAPFNTNHLLQLKKNLLKQEALSCLYAGMPVVSQLAEILQEEVVLALEELKIIAAGILEVEKGTPGYCSAPFNKDYLAYETKELLKKQFLLALLTGKDSESPVFEVQKIYDTEINKLSSEIESVRLGISEIERGTLGYCSAPFNGDYLKNLEDKLVELKAYRSLVR